MRAWYHFRLELRCMDAPGAIWTDLINDLVIINVLVVLVIAILANAIVRRAINHHLAHTADSARRTGISFMRNAVKTLILLAATLAIICSIPSLRSISRIV